MGLESLSTYAQSSNSLLATVLILLLLPLFRYAYLDYQGWHALGAGGLPHNVFGWLVQSLLRLPASRRVRDSSCYDAATGSTELEKTSFFDDQLPKWTGEPPKTAVWVVPHRQVEQAAGAKIKKALEANLSHIVDSNPQYLELGPSKIEGGAPALFVSPKYCSSGHAKIPRSPREVFHSHCSADGSSHAVLSAADAKLVLDSGWGEMHGFSGRVLGFPLGYVMIFAPRNMLEVETVGMIARAAARAGPMNSPPLAILEGVSYNSGVDEKAYKELSKYLGRCITLSCCDEGIASLLYSAFFEPKVPCNLIGAYISSVKKAIAPARSDPKVFASLMARQNPKLSALWLAAIWTGHAGKILDCALGDWPPISLPVVSWMGALQSFLQAGYYSISNQNGFVPRAEDFSTIYLLHPDARTPFTPPPPFWRNSDIRCQS